MSVVNPCMFVEPVPETYHWLGGFPGRQFSASIAFLGALHEANAENVSSKCATVKTRIRQKTKRLPENLVGDSFATSRRGAIHIRAECARTKMKKIICIG